MTKSARKYRKFEKNMLRAFTEYRISLLRHPFKKKFEFEVEHDGTGKNEIIRVTIYKSCVTRYNNGALHFVYEEVFSKQDTPKGFTKKWMKNVINRLCSMHSTYKCSCKENGKRRKHG